MVCQHSPLGRHRNQDVAAMVCGGRRLNPRSGQQPIIKPLPGTGTRFWQMPRLLREFRKDRAHLRGVLFTPRVRQLDYLLLLGIIAGDGTA